MKPKIVLKEYTAIIKRGRVQFEDRGTEVDEQERELQDENPITENIQKLAIEVGQFNQQQTQIALAMKHKGQFKIFQKSITNPE
jgi:hypothetical protein